MKTNNKTNLALDGIDAASGLLSLLHPGLTAITVITFVIRQIIAFASPDDIVARMKKIESKLAKKKITIEDFKTKALNMTEHNSYIARNNLNYILVNCIPETLDVYIELWIDYIMKDTNSIQEELCEILSSLNKSDLTLLEMIKSFNVYGEKKYFDERELARKETIKKLKEQQVKDNTTKNNSRYIKTNWVDRDIIIDGKTIFWKDFSNYYELNVNEMGYMILMNGVLENGQETMIWAYYVRSFVKLDRLGIIQLDYNSTLGTINSLNIDRFHITLFGEQLLEYIPLIENIEIEQ